MKKRKGKIDIEIGGFAIFMIIVFGVLPLVKMIANKDEVQDTTGTVSVATVVKGGYVEIKGNTGNAYINTQVKIPIKAKTFRVTITSPEDKEESKMVKTKSKYIATTFDKAGLWEIDMYDSNGLLLDWVKITAYEGI